MRLITAGSRLYQHDVNVLFTLVEIQLAKNKDEHCPFIRHYSNVCPQKQEKGQILDLSFETLMFDIVC